MASRQEMTAETKEIVDRTMNGEKTLSLSSRLEAPHLTLALSSGLMGTLSPIIQAWVLLVGDTR